MNSNSPDFELVNEASDRFLRRFEKRLEHDHNKKETNTANHTSTIVNSTKLHFRNFKGNDTEINVLVFNSHFRGLRNVIELLKWLP